MLLNSLSSFRCFNDKFSFTPLMPSGGWEEKVEEKLYDVEQIADEFMRSWVQSGMKWDQLLSFLRQDESRILHPRAVSFFHSFWWNYHHFARAEEKCFIGEWEDESSSDRWDVDGGKIANKNETCKSFAPNPSAPTIPSGQEQKITETITWEKEKKKIPPRPTSSSPVIPECNKNCINLYNNKGSRKAKAKKAPTEAYKTS